MTMGIRAILGLVSLHKSMVVEVDNQELIKVLVASKESQLELINKYNKSIEKMESIQSTLDDLIFNVDQYFDMLKKHFGV